MFLFYDISDRQTGADECKENIFMLFFAGFFHHMMLQFF